MTTFKAYGLGLNERDYELIRKMCQIVTTSHVSIKDLRYYDIKLEDTKNSVLLLFGKKTERLAQDVKNKKLLFLPDIYLLHPTGCQKSRLKAFEQLKLLKISCEEDSIPLNNEVILEESIPDLTIDQLKILEKNLSQKGVDTWLGTTKNGKTVQLSLEPKEGNADIKMTFSELYAIKIAIEALEIKEFTIVYSNKNT